VSCKAEQPLGEAARVEGTALKPYYYASNSISSLSSSPFMLTTVQSHA